MHINRPYAQMSLIAAYSLKLEAQLSPKGPRDACHKMVLYIYFKFCTSLTCFFWCMRIGKELWIFPVHGVVKGHDVLEKKNGI